MKPDRDAARRPRAGAARGRKDATRRPRAGAANGPEDGAPVPPSSVPPRTTPSGIPLEPCYGLTLSLCHFANPAFWTR